MKKISLALAAILGLTVLAPVTAEAGHRTRVTYDCGYRVNWEYRFVGRDCHGCPIYRWVVVSRCAPRYTPPCDDGYNGGYGGYSGYRSGGCRY